MTDEELTQYLFNRGYIPKWAYYQLNGKTADENYNIQRQKMMERVKVEAEIEQGVEEVLIDLLKDWQ